jgi:hypothetical protein
MIKRLANSPAAFFIRVKVSGVLDVRSGPQIAHTM